MTDHTPCDILTEEIERFDASLAEIASDELSADEAERIELNLNRQILLSHRDRWVAAREKIAELPQGISFADVCAAVDYASKSVEDSSPALEFERQLARRLGVPIPALRAAVNAKPQAEPCPHENVKFFAATGAEPCSQGNATVGINARCSNCGTSWTGDVQFGVARLFAKTATPDRPEHHER